MYELFLNIQHKSQLKHLVQEANKLIIGSQYLKIGQHRFTIPSVIKSGNLGDAFLNKCNFSISVWTFLSHLLNKYKIGIKM